MSASGKSWGLIWALLLALGLAGCAAQGADPAPEAEAGLPAQARELRQAGQKCFDQGRYACARDSFQQALEAAKKALGHEHPQTGRAYNDLAKAQMKAGDLEPARASAQTGLDIRRQALGPRHPDTAESLDWLARVQIEQGHYQEALANAQKGLSLRQELLGAEAAATAESWETLTVILIYLGRYTEALEAAENCKAIRFRVLGREHADTANAYNNLGGAYYSLGEYPRALESLQQALAIKTEVLGLKHADTAQGYNNLGTVYTAMGEYPQALESFGQALALRLQVLGTQHAYTASSHDNLGTIYVALGDYHHALDNHRQALAIRLQVLGSQHPLTATSYNNLGVVHSSMNENQRALETHQQALSIKLKAMGPKHPDTATSYNNLGAAYSSLGEYARALENHRQALAIRLAILGPEHPDTANSYNNLGAVYFLLGEYPQALENFQKALLTGQGSWYSSSWLGATHAKLEHPAATVFFYKQAVNTIQGMRGKLTSLPKELQTSFLVDKEHVYRDLADKLVEMGRLPEAQEVMGLLKQEEYFDLVRRDAGQAQGLSGAASYSAVEEAHVQRYQALSRDAVAVGRELEALRQKAKAGELDAADQAREAQLRARLTQCGQALEAYFNELNVELEKAYGRRGAELTLKELEDLRGLQSTLRNMGHRSVLLTYLVLQDKLHIILTTPETQVARVSQVSAAELGRLIQTYREILRNPRRDPLPSAQALYAMVLAPVARDLEDCGAQTLMVSLDEALRYLPLAALHDGQRYMVERFDLAVFTAASRDKLRERPASSWRVAGFGVSQGLEGFNPLPGVQAELRGIVRDGAGDAQGVLPGEMRLDGSFTADEMKRLLDKGFPAVHIASHFVLRAGKSGDSFLLLGDGQHLTLDRITHEGFRFDDADLLTLSACDTAVGGKGDGREVEGLGVLAQRQGAKGVIATLWPVADQSTGIFMRDFYRLRQGEAKLTKAEALRQAQLRLLRGQAGQPSGGAEQRGETFAAGKDEGFKAPAEAPYAHPHFWAPFIIMGNWL
jgi:CHAT domain-containing protein/Tfp pilus assembly protein PilF